MVTRDILLREHLELIILCLDANNLKRSLMLASQIFELAIPVVACLNMIDESQQKGIQINREKLAQQLGVPVVETVASEGHGIKQLLKKIPQAAAPREKIHYRASHRERGARDRARLSPGATLPRAVALLLLEQDQAVEHYLRETWAKRCAAKAGAAAADVRRKFRGPLARHILEKRTRWADRIEREVTRSRDYASRAGLEK